MAQKRLIIIGASSGIGHEVARLFINKGYTVGVAARRIQALEQLKNIAPERVFTKAIDVTKANASTLLEELIKVLGGMDVYIHVSGIGKQNTALIPEQEEITFATNVEGFGALIGVAYRYFREKGTGHIAAVTSIAGTKGLGIAPSYSATKRFQSTYLQALCQLTHMEHSHVTITDIQPGFVDTAFLASNQKYPLIMPANKVADKIVKAIEKKKRKVIIDWKFACITFVWNLIPNCIWERLHIATHKKDHTTPLLPSTTNKD